MRMSTYQEIYDALHFSLIFMAVIGVFILAYFGKETTGTTSVCISLIGSRLLNILRVRSDGNNRTVGVGDKS